MIDARLVTPVEVEDLAVEVLRARHVEHLAAHERRHGLAPRTLERLRTVSHLAAQSDLLSGDKLPAALIGSPGLAVEPQRTADQTLDLVVSLGVEVTVIGQGRRDTLRRRDWTTWTVIECLLQRLPRGDTINQIRLQDVQSLEQADAHRIRGQARVLFAVVARGAVDVRVRSHDDPRWPLPADPYLPPADGPVVTSVEIDVERVALID